MFISKWNTKKILASFILDADKPVCWHRWHLRSTHATIWDGASVFFFFLCRRIYCCDVAYPRTQRILQLSRGSDNILFARSGTLDRSRSRVLLRNKGKYAYEHVCVFVQMTNCRKSHESLREWEWEDNLCFAIIR